MSGFEQLLRDYQQYQQACTALFAGRQSVAAQPVRVSRERRELNEAAVRAALTGLGAVEGWLLLSDRRLVLAGESIDELPARVLEGELHAGGESIRLRTLAPECWLWVSSRLQSCEAAAATHLATAIVHRAVSPRGVKLRYQQLWCRDSSGRLHIEDAVFTGFEELQG